MAGVLCIVRCPRQERSDASGDSDNDEDNRHFDETVRARA
jgi:hypothetical protein